jgi:hypothetical protein
MPEMISIEHGTAPEAKWRQQQSTLAAPGATLEQNATVLEILQQMSEPEAVQVPSIEEDDTPGREKESESKSRQEL